ncbi:hypothetical protein L4D18_07440 [Vibrio campbellii]|uniref:hypothetical protein n=1 Tax=Vibrio campbellii TaxID=680 RepID=UPI00315597B6
MVLSDLDECYWMICLDENTHSWSWDVGYQYHDELKADVTSVNVKTWFIESALRYDWYLQDNLSLYGQLAAYWDME